MGQRDDRRAGSKEATKLRQNDGVEKSYFAEGGNVWVCYAYVGLSWALQDYAKLSALVWYIQMNFHAFWDSRYFVVPRE